MTKLQTYLNEKVPDDILFSIPSITTEQVLSYINILYPTKATGLGGLGPKIIKLAATNLAPFIAALINKSISSGTFPSQLKCAKVFPVFKGGAKSYPSNYRPISILPTVSKLFEKPVNKHLMNYLNKYKLIHETQSGFRQKHSCQTALVKLLDQWMACIDKGGLVGSLFIDFRKAFNVADHSILMKKLALYKLNESSLNWFRSYLGSVSNQSIMAKAFPNLYRLHQVSHRDLISDQHYFYCSLTTSHFSRNTASVTLMQTMVPFIPTAIIR